MALPLTTREYEKLTPRQVAAEWNRAPIAYVPLGTYEWHGHHLPIGLDALKAHRLCLLAAERTGGLVLAPFFYGTGGGHQSFPHTIMLEKDIVVAVLRQTLRRLPEFGVRVAVLFTGHFPHEQTDMVKELAAACSTPRLRVLGLSDAFFPDPPFRPDHAGLFETSLMMGAWPEMVHLEEAQGESRDTTDPGDPLYGIHGDDPRKAEPRSAKAFADQMVAWLAAQARAALKEPAHA